MTLHISFFEGGNALSDFRIQQLLPRLAQISPNIQGLAARFVHLVATETTLQGDQEKTLAALLAYGDPYTGHASGPTDGPVIVVSPRLGTVSPWASKASDIARNCGLPVRRLERIVGDMLSVSEIEAGSFKLRTGDVRLENLFDDLKGAGADLLTGGDVMERTDKVPAGMQVFFAILDKPEQLIQDAATPHTGYNLDPGIYRFDISREFNPFTEQARRVAD